MSVKQFITESYPEGIQLFFDESNVETAMQIRDEIMERWGKSYLYLRGHLRDVMQSNDLQIIKEQRKNFEWELFLIVIETLFESDVAIGFVGLCEETATQYIFALLNDRDLIESEE